VTCMAPVMSAPAAKAVSLKHSSPINCPLFKKKVVVVESRMVWDEPTMSEQLVTGKARLVRK